MTNPPVNRGPLVWAARACVAAAASAALYLAWVSVAGGQIAGCGAGSGCDAVLASAWSHWLGIPVGVPAAIIYLALAASTWGRSRVLALGLSLLILAAALWFAGVQYFLIGRWCRVCLFTHASGSLGALFVLARMRATLPSILRAAAIAGAGFLVLLTGQIAVKGRTYAVGPAIQVGTGRFPLDPRSVPHLGEKTGGSFTVLLFDYTCVHCRHLHGLVAQLEKRSPAAPDIVLLPVPLEAECNPLILDTSPANEHACEYAKLALAVWRARPEAYPDFDTWMCASNPQPSLEAALAKAQALAGGAALAAALTDTWVSGRLKADVALYLASSREIHDSRLPQLIFADATIEGDVSDERELETLFAAHRPFAPNPRR